MTSVRFHDPGMHSPGHQTAHCLPVAGVKTPIDRDLFRLQRVVPAFGPDPCIGPNQGHLLCPEDCGHEKRNHFMSPAGVTSSGSDVFQFYATRQTAPRPRPMEACGCPVFANNPPCTSLGPVTDPLQCPCINRTNMGQGKCHSQTIHRVGSSTPSSYAPENSVCPTYGDNQRLKDVLIPSTPHGMRQGAVAPTPNAWTSATAMKTMMAIFGRADDQCQNPYYPSNYICRPVYDRKYLDDCPEQNGPPADVYTFL